MKLEHWLTGCEPEAYKVEEDTSLKAFVLMLAARAQASETEEGGAE